MSAPLAAAFLRRPTRVLRATAVTLLVCLPALLPSCGDDAPPPAATTLTVAAASSLRELLEGSRAAFLAQHPGAELAFSFEASSTLSRQIEEGAAFDAFLSADAASVDRIGTHLAAGTRRVFLSNRLALVGREGLADPPADPAALAAGTQSVALAGPAVPAGKYARAWLTGKGLLAAIEPRCATADNVRAALALVESGTADVAFVYLTDAKIAKHATLLWTAPPADDPGIAYVAAALAGRAPLAAGYVAWLGTPEFLRQAEALGFLPPSAP